MAHERHRKLGEPQKRLRAGKQYNERSEDLGLFNLKGRDQRNDLIISQCKKKKKAQNKTNKNQPTIILSLLMRQIIKVFFIVLPILFFLF